MPTYAITLSSWSSTGSVGYVAWSNPGNAEYQDNIDASNVGIVATDPTQFLQGVGPTPFSPSPNEYLESISAAVWHGVSPGLQCLDRHFYLVKAGAQVLASDNYAMGYWAGTAGASSLVTYTWDASALAASGIGLSDCQNSQFGVSLQATLLQTGTAYVDAILLTLTTAYAAPSGMMGVLPTYGTR